MNSTNLNYGFSEQVMPPEQASKVGKLYKEVFATPPWNEAVRCKKCRKNFGKEWFGVSGCPDCDGKMEDYYDLEKLTVEIAETSRLIGFKIATIMSGESLIGFWFGWNGTLEEINRQKLRLANRELSSIDGLRLEDKYFYLSEFGVSPELRGRNLGKRLFQFGMEKIGLATVMRTNTNSPAFFIARKNGFQTIWSYGDQSYRVLLSNKI